MKGILRFFGMSIGGALGWWAGERIGLVTAMVLSSIGSGLGLWATFWIGREWME